MKQITKKQLEKDNFELELDNEKELLRRKYLHEYYQKNKDKARAYQRHYNLNHRKKVNMNRINIIQDREPIQMTYTIRDIALSPTEKSLKMFNLILSQQRNFSFHISKPAR